MLSWEATPPAAAWESVSRQLQENRAEQQLATRFEQISIEPPAGNWEPIAAALSSARRPAPVFSIRPIGSKIARYGAAAAVAGVLLWNFLSRTNTAPVAPAPALSGMTSRLVPPVTASTTEPLSADAGPQAQKELDQATVPSVIPSKRPLRCAILHAALEAYTIVLPKPEPQAYHQPAGPGLVELPVQQRDLRYILIPKENGLTQRLSAKFASMLYGARNSEEESSDGTAHPLLKDLEKKMLNNVYVPDPANLFDLVMFSQFIQEEQ